MRLEAKWACIRPYIVDTVLLTLCLLRWPTPALGVHISTCFYTKSTHSSSTGSACM